MALEEQLLENKDAIVHRWLRRVLAAYGEDAAAMFRRQRDPFANPVGESLRTATAAIFDGLLGSTDEAEIRRQLHKVLKIRAVQQLDCSEAVGFVFQLKEAIRAELPEAASRTPISAWTKLERQIDQWALAAFDIYMQYREQLYNLRINEIKRMVPWVVTKRAQRQGASSRPAEPAQPHAAQNGDMAEEEC